MAYKLQTDIGKWISGLRKCTVEPVIGIIKEVLRFRQFSLRGLVAAAGEWCLVSLAFRLRRQAFARFDARAKAGVLTSSVRTSLVALLPQTPGAHWIRKVGLTVSRLRSS